MSATKESIDKEKAIFQSPNSSPTHTGVDSNVRPISPLTIGVIKTVNYKSISVNAPKPKEELPKIDLEFIPIESETSLLFMRQGKPTVKPDPTPPQSFSYNAIPSNSSKVKK